MKFIIPGIIASLVAEPTSAQPSLRALSNEGMSVSIAAMQTETSFVTPPETEGEPANPSTVIKSTKSAKAAKSAKSSSELSLTKYPTCDLVYEDANRAECETWCTEYFSVCKNPNFFSKDHGWEQCIADCVAYPRTNTVVSRPPATFHHLMGDTWACRDLHLWEAQNDPSGYGAFHCSHSIPTGGSICTDVKIDGKTPYQTLRDGACTQHYFGYCFLSSEDTVADCSKADITDGNLPSALAMLPDTVEYIFMMENEGITELPEGLFDNLVAPEKVKAIYFDDCNIKDMHEEVFHPLENLEILTLSFNRVVLLQDELLKLPKLRQFHIIGDPTAPPPSPFGPAGGRKPGMLTSASFTNKLFQYSKELERIMMFAHRGIDKLHAGMFEGLSKVNAMYWVFCGLTEAGIPDDVFYPLTGMVYFDLQGNYFKTIPTIWFEKEGGWSKNVERLIFFTNDLSEVEEEIFSWHPKLTEIYFHDNPRLDTIPASYYKNNPDLETLTV